MDHETGRSRGTGFVCFWSVEDADKVVEKSDLLRLETSESTSTVFLALHCRVYAGDADMRWLGQAQSIQASFDINPRSLVELGTELGPARKDTGRCAGSHQERGNETEGRGGEETREDRQTECVSAPRRR